MACWKSFVETFKHPLGFSHWQLCLSHFLRALGSDAVGDLQNDTWPWRLEFLAWRVRIGLDWIDFWFQLSFRRKQTWMKFADGILTSKIVFTTVVRKDVQITWSSRQGWQKTLLSRCRKRLKEAIHQHEATIDRFFFSVIFVETCIEMSQRNLPAQKNVLENL